MSEWDEPEGVECPMCGFTQTAPDVHEEDCWFCFLCGVTWNPDKETYDQELKVWLTWDEETQDWIEQ